MARRIVKRGSVVLIHYPFTDLSGVKVRPAVVIAPNFLLQRVDDVLCLFISSSMPSSQLPSDLVLDPTYPAFAQSGLRVRSVLRCHKLTSLHKNLVIRVLGTLDTELMAKVDERLIIALGL
jgi:mRNA interferase MazF